MTRREELAQVRERAAAGNPRCRWTYVAVNGQPMECRYALSIHDQIGNAHAFVGPPDWADRRFLLGLVDELAAALRYQWLRTNEPHDVHILLDELGLWAGPDA